MIPKRQLRSLADLQPGDHLCSFHENEEERRAVLRSFISQGIERGEKILYIHEDSDDENALKDLSELGVGVEDCLEKGSLNLVTEAETYLQNGAFDPGRMIGLLQAETERALAQGYPALRAVGATGWVHRRQPGSDHLIEYEAKLSTFFSKNKCLALCPYDLRKFDPSLLLNVLASHPFVITGAEVYENIYYIPPKELLGENFLEAALRYFLRNLKVQTQAQAERRTIEAVLADLFAIASDGIILVDQNQRILTFNRGAEKIFGYRSEEVLGRPVDLLMPSRFAEHHRQRIEEYVKAPEMAQKMGQPGEIFGRRKDGAEFPVEASVTKLSQNGDLFFTVILRDISHRRQAEANIREEKDKFQALFDGVPVPSYVWQRQGEDFILVTFNCAARDYSRGRANELLGKTLAELYGDRPEVIEDFSRCFREKITIRREFAQTSFLTGQWRDFIVHYVPVAADLVLVHTEDTTERKRAEQALRLQGQIIEQIHDAVVSTDLDGYVTSWNKGAESLYGYSAAETLGKHISILYGEDQLDFLQQEVIAPLKEKGVHEVEVVLKNKDGQDFDGHLSLSLLRDVSGNPKGMIGYTMDISALKRTQRELQIRARMQAVEAELGQLALAGGDLQALMDQIVSKVAQTLEVGYCKILELQPGGESLLLKAGVGWKDGAVGRAFVDARENSQAGHTLHSNQPVVANDLRTETRFTIQSLLSEHGVVSGMSVIILGAERPYGTLGAHTVRQREFSGEEADFLASVAHVLANAIQRKQAEDHLAYQAHLLDTVHDAIFAMDENLVLTSWNKGAERLYGWKEGEVLGRRAVEITRTDFSEEELLEFGRRLAEAGYISYELTQHHRDGHPIYIEGNSMALRSEEGDITGYLTVNRDITDRKEAERALSESEQRFRQLSENIQEVFWMTNGDGDEILYVSPAYEKVWGRKLADLYADPGAWEAAIQPLDRERVKAVFTPEKLMRGEYDIEYRITRPDGSMRWIRDRGFPVRDEDGRFYRIAGIAEDITEQRQTEDVLQHHADRLKILHEIDHSILAAESLESIAEAALRCMGELIPYKRSSVVLFDYDYREGIISAIHACDEDRLLPGTKVPIGIFGDLEKLRAGEIFEVEDLEAISLPVPAMQLLQTRGYGSYVCLPLITRDELFGVLNMGFEQSGRLPADLIQVAREVADSVALAIQQTRLFNRVQDGSKRLRELSRQVVTAQEQERRRVSRELHDEASQALMALKISLDMLQRDLPAEADSLHQRAEEALGLADETMEGIRLLAHDLRPPELDAVGLDPVLEDYCREFGRRARFDVDYRGTRLPALPDEISIGFYRVLQEALTNILKHAHARHVQVALSCVAGAITLSVADDGHGFDLAADHEFPDGHGIGLLGMRERVELLGGRLEVQSHPGQGTRVQATVPWEKCA
jgi:PAS domain S-box-containing protein